MQELVDWCAITLKNQQYHPLLILANFLVSFLQIHPFIDGNGRLSRLLTNYILMTAGYLYTPFVSHEKLIEDSKADYYKCLRSSQKTFNTDQESIAVWVDYFLNILLAQAEKARELLTGSELEQSLSPKQLKILRYIISTDDEKTPKQIVQATNIKRITVNQGAEKVGWSWQN